MDRLKTVLVLGAGLVARPLVQYLLGQAGFRVKVASRTRKKVENLISGHPRGEVAEVDAADLDGIRRTASDVDLVISLLPVAHHVSVAKVCLDLGKHLVTTSYVSPEMQALDEKAREKGLLFLNESGLDPGIDHMSALKIIHQIKRDGGILTGFSSYCGGLPAPEANTNPFGYKFSWSPRGVVLAAKKGARFLKDGREVVVPPEDLFLFCELVKIPDDGEFEVYPNRNSLEYIDKYGIPTVKNMFRGTLRNIGHCATWKKIVDLGLLDEEKVYDLKGYTHRRFMADLLGCPREADLKFEIASKIKIEPDSDFLEKIEWLGMLSDDPISLESACALDVFVERLVAKLQYQQGESDMIVLHHKFSAEYPEEKKTEVITSTLIDFGIPGGDTAMARTVGLPAAICARMILEGKISLSGVHIPIHTEIYEPVLNELEPTGIIFRERRQVGALR